MIYPAAIVGDFVGSSAYTSKEFQELLKEVESTLRFMEKKFKVKYRIVRGDQMEVFIPDGTNALRCLLLLKCACKASFGEVLSNKQRLSEIPKNQRSHVVRLAMVVAPMTAPKGVKEMWSGEAIFSAGRFLQSQHTATKLRKVVKQSIYLQASNKNQNSCLQLLEPYIEKLMLEATPKQCAAMVQKLKGLSDTELADAFEVSYVGINRMLYSAGWKAIASTLAWFEKN